MQGCQKEKKNMDAAILRGTEYCLKCVEEQNRKNVSNLHKVTQLTST